MPPGEYQSFTASYDTASYDKTTKIITAVVLFILVGADVFTRSAVVAGLGALVFALAYAYSPRGYAIADRSIMVKRLIGNVRIPLDAIREVRSATHDDFRAALRLWGSGGLFGYYGIFQTAHLGKSTWYVTNRNRAVVVVTGSKTVLFSPDDVAGFITAIHEAVPVPQADGTGSQREPGRSFGSTGRLIGLTVAVLAIALVALAMLYAPGPPSYTLTSDAVTIHDRFYPVAVHASEVDIDQIRVIDLDRDTEWRPTLRTNGFANSHYQSGWFRGGQWAECADVPGRRPAIGPVTSKGRGHARAIGRSRPGSSRGRNSRCMGTWRRARCRVMATVRYAGEEIMADQAETESVSPAPPVSNPAWERVQLARHPKRPHSLDYIQRIFTGFQELHGDRGYADDPAVVCGMAWFDAQPVMIVAQQKGRDTKQKLHRNFGMPKPEGYRKAMRLMRLAAKFGRPVICLVDTPGAYPGIDAEERGEAEAIAVNLREMSRLPVPVIVVVIGEGGSGGALAIAVGNRVYMLENAIYSVISPESCAAIIYRDAGKAPSAAEALKLTAPDLLELKLIDGIIAEPEGGAQNDYDASAEAVRHQLRETMVELTGTSPEKCIEERYRKFREMGNFFTGGAA